MNLMTAYDMLQNSHGEGFKSDDGSVIIKTKEDLIKLAEAEGECTENALTYIKTIKKGESATEGFTKYCASGFSQLGKGLLNLGKNIAVTFSKAALSFGISWLVTTGISLIVQGIDKIINKEKYAKQAAEEVKQTIKETNNQYTNVSKTVDGLKDRYAELAQKVGNLGTLGQNQGGLSNDEYEEFLDLSNQLAELFPRLTKGYDDNGVAILDLSGNVDTIVGSLNNLVEAEERAANRTALESMDELWVDYSYRVDEARESLEKLNDEFNGNIDDVFEGYTQAYDAFKEAISSDSPILFDFDFEGSDGYFSEALRRAGTGWNELKVFDDDLGHYRYDFSKLSEDQISAIDDAFANIRSEYLAQVKSYEDTIGDANREIGTYMSQAMKTVDYYDSLSDVEKQMMDAFIMNFDFETLQDQFNGDWTQTYNAFQTILRDSFGSVSDADRVLIQKYYSDLFAIDMSSGSYQENVEKVREYARLIAAILGDEFSETDILELLGFNDLGDKITKAREHAGYNTGDNLSEEQKARNEAIDSWINSMSEEELDLFMTLSFDPEQSVEAMQRAFNDAQKYADNNPVEVKVKASDAVDSMADAKTAITSLEELWNQTVKNSLSLGKDKKYLDENGNVIKQLNDKNQAIGFADPATINSVESAFYKFSEALEKEGNDAAANKINLALEEFQKTLTEFPGDADKAQEAIDNLITAYIDQTDIIQNLTEENAEWSKAQLEAYGVTNAEEVVMSRLSTTTKQLTKQFKSATDALQGLTNAQADNYDEQSMQTVQDQLNSMFSTDALWNGETLTPNFDPTWIIQNLDMLKEAAAGSTDAMWELQKVAAQKIAAQIDINAPTPAAVNDIQNQINSLISNFDIKDVTVGTSINTSPMIKGLNSLVDAGVITRDSMNAILSGIGVEPQVTYKDIPISVNMAAAKNELRKQATTGENYYNSKYMLDAIDNGTLTGNVRIPVIDYVVSGKSTGAKYAAPSGGSSSGGGGGGGGGGSSSEPNEPKEEAEETFDWIEVAIQRIEEEIARLDKVVGNSYDAWIRRNDALLKEINKTKDEIKAQQLAQEEYLRNANKVQVNNGEGLNPDDYGENDQLVKAQDQKLLDEAKKAWATGQYQKKVREGLLTGDDIEKIQNHFLSDTVRFFQELYNKSVAAGDAVQDLKIKLGDLARTNFDHVKSEYEETLAYFDAYSSLIDERINRTEEKGYFVSKKYYSDLIAYDNKSLNALQKEYNDLIKKRDEAVTSGAILSGSSEWNAMNQEILDVANSIEQATTKLVEFSNQMRQIDWDVFDFLQDRIGKVNDEFEFLVDLLDNQKLYDDWGMFNERGWADTALHASKYNTYMQQALDYAKEREKIEGELAKDRADKNLIERREELIQLQQESIKNAYAEKEAVKDLVSEGINIHLQALQKLIDDYKKAQQESKSLYDYQKNIAKQTENIGNLRKQLNAYAGDTSEEARATIQRLNQQLKDAEQSLQETEWDKYISETQTFLDDMYQDYEETLNKRLDDIDLLMHDMIDSVNSRGGEIRDIINTVSGEVGYRLTENANTFLKNGTLVSDFKTNFDSYATTTEKMLNDIKNYVSSISNKTVAEGINNTEKLQNPTRVNGFNTTYKGVDYGSVFDLNYYMQKYPDLVKAFGNDYDKYLEHFVNHGMKEGRRASETFDVQYYRSKYADLNGHWGNDWEQYFKHFLNHGIQEGRQGSAEFDVQKYKASYADLQKSLGDVLGRYYKHYNQYGIGEGRKGNTFIRDGIDYSPVFDPKYYADRWSDLKKWYGYDSIKLFNHFVDHGMKEGRQASANFNPAKYKEYYNDLAQSYGNDWKKYFMHYLNHGIFEGRKGYKVGAHNISTAQMAWTQEAGGELIYRSTDGAILTPLNVGDKVFTAEMSENLWNLAQLKQRPFVPTNTGGKTINNTNAISITLPNVQNYEQFKTAMQNDPKMTQFIQQITLGEATNGVKLNKKRY